MEGNGCSSFKQAEGGLVSNNCRSLYYNPLLNPTATPLSASFLPLLFFLRSSKANNYVANYVGYYVLNNVEAAKGEGRTQGINIGVGLIRYSVRLLY